MIIMIHDRVGQGPQSVDIIYHYGTSAGPKHETAPMAFDRHLILVNSVSLMLLPHHHEPLV